jgi:hypothetical protein
MRSSAFVLLLLLSASSAWAGQDYTGTYTSRGEWGPVTVTLEQESQDQMKGVMMVEEMKLSLLGNTSTQGIRGTISGPGIRMNFTGNLQGERLVLQLMELDEEGQPDTDTAETLILQKQESSTSSTPPPSKTSQVAGSSRTEEAAEPSGVVINGVSLSQEQITNFEQTYGAKPRPGKYWYDQRSGLYGVVGYPAFGFLLAGHDFGKMGERVSNGDTDVFVNGRELPQSEWAVWSQLLGYMIQPGRYWLDENGNAGYDGNPVPTENLYLAAQRSAYAGAGGGGDNFWSTRFSAGNYDSGNQRGYVSVPGYGPVGYGF